jgi:hypothetical protein
MKAAPALAMGMLFAAAAGAQTNGRDARGRETDEASALQRNEARGAGPLRIRTSPPACLLAAGFPVIRSLIDPADAVASANLFFRPEAYPLWYEVPMHRRGSGFLAVLPKPRPSAQRVHYYVEATAPGRPRARGPQLSAPVVEDAARCGGAPAEMVESAAVGVRVPRGAPAVPPVPPGFSPVGAAAIEEARTVERLPFIMAGGVAAGMAGGMAFAGKKPPGGSAQAGDEIAFLDSNPPPDARISISAGGTFTVRMRVGTRRAIGPGNLRVVLYQTLGSPTGCAILLSPHGGFPAGTSREVVASGRFLQAQVCQPSDRLHLAVEENGQIVVGTAPDVPVRYFLDP